MKWSWQINIMLLGAVVVAVGLFGFLGSDPNYVCPPVGPSTTYFSCPNLNQSREQIFQSAFLPALGISGFLSTRLYARGLRFEFWFFWSGIFFAGIIVPLYLLLINPGGIDTGLHLWLQDTYPSNGFWVILPDTYKVPLFSTSFSFFLTVLSVLAGVALGPSLQKLWDSRKSLVSHQAGLPSRKMTE